MSQLPITNVVNISVSQAQLGLGAYNVNNVVLFTTDAPAESFGSLGYALYLEPTTPAKDFGSSSSTAGMANALFSQQPNILAGGGYLAILTYVPQSQTITFDEDATGGSLQLLYNGHSVSIAHQAAPAVVQASLRALATASPASCSALAQVIVTGAGDANTPYTVAFYGVYKNTTLFTLGSNTLTPSTGVVIAESVPAESLGEAITRTQGLVNYFGIMTNQNVDALGSPDTMAAAAVVQPLNAMLFVVGNEESDIGSGNVMYSLTAAGFDKTRSLYYGQTFVTPPLVDTGALNECAGYVGRALSTNFNGSNTTQTMHLKQLIGTQPDVSLSQAILMEAITAGADTYPSLQGVPGVFCSGENQYFDDVYNLQWLIGALQVAGFNYLAQSSTKVPQTEQGMNGLKGAYRAVAQQAVANQYLAPGAWTSSTTFGNQIDFLANIATYGYYIYSAPISQQSAASRAARQAPLIQIAIKLAGAIQSSDVIVFVNP